MSNHSASTRANSAAPTPLQSQPHSHSHSQSPRLQSSVRTTGSSALFDRGPRALPPRSLPPWIDSYSIDSSDSDDDDAAADDENDDSDPLQPPSSAIAVAKPGVPTVPSRRISHDGYVEENDPLAHRARQPRVKFPGFIANHTARRNRGRKWDHLRNAEPVIVATVPAGSNTRSNQNPWVARTTGAAPRVTSPTSARSPTWNDFLHSSAYGRGSARSWGVRDPDILHKLQPDFDKPVQMDMTTSGRKIPRARQLRRLSHSILFHSWSPFLIRTVAIIFSIVSLGLSCRIFQLSDPRRAPAARSDFDQDAEMARTQSLFVLVVDILLIPYVGYMLVDEYKGKPLGLRSTVQKTWLILADVLFIILKSAATALVIESLVLNRDDADWWAFFGGNFGALASFLIVSLVVWTTTLIVNVFRMVERLGGSRGTGMLGSDGWEHRYMREYMV